MDNTGTPPSPDTPERTRFAADPTGRVTLLSYKRHPRMSDETTAFEATIVLDGKRVGTATNTGTGGPHRYHFASVEVKQSVTRIAEQWATENNESSIEQLDQFIDYIATGIEDKQVARRLYRKNQKQITNISGVVVVEKEPLFGGGYILGFGVREYILTSSLDDVETLAIAKHHKAWRFHVIPVNALG